MVHTLRCYTTMQMNRCLACLVVSYKQIAPSFSMFKETSTNVLLRKAMLTSKEIIKALPLFSTTMFNIVIKLKNSWSLAKAAFGVLIDAFTWYALKMRQVHKCAANKSTIHYNMQSFNNKACANQMDV